MNPGRRPDGPRKTPRRHAGDVVFHLQNAQRSLNNVLHMTRDPAAYALAEQARTQLKAVLVDVEECKRALGREQARRKSAHVANP